MTRIFNYFGCQYCFSMELSLRKSVMHYRETTRQSFEKDLQACRHVSLFAFLKTNSSTAEQIDNIEKTAKFYKNSVGVFVSDRDFDFFAERLHFSGSPVFLLFKNGKEVSRFLGMAEYLEIRNFIGQHFSRITSK